MVGDCILSTPTICCCYVGFSNYILTTGKHKCTITAISLLMYIIFACFYNYSCQNHGYSTIKLHY
jgi:hypothetical protein